MSWLEPLKRHWLLALKLLLGAACIYIAYRSVDPSNWSVLGGRVDLLALMILGWIVNQALCGVRMRELLKIYGYDLSHAGAQQLTFASFFVASVLPGLVFADVARVAMLRLMHRSGNTSEFAVVAVIDRLLGFLSLLVVSLMMSFFIKLPNTALANWLLGLTYAAGIAVAAIAVVAWMFRRSFKPAEATTNERFFAKVWRRVLELARAASSPRAARLILVAALPSVLSAVVFVAAQAYVGAAFMAELGQPRAFDVQLFLAPISMGVSKLPITPSGVGVGQLSLAALYEVSGLSGQTAIVLMTLVQIAQVLTAATIGAASFWLLRRDAKPS